MPTWALLVSRRGFCEPEPVRPVRAEPPTRRFVTMARHGEVAEWTKAAPC